MHKYEIILYWSEEDQVFIAEVPELPGCMAHGDTQGSALTNANEAVQLWIETAQEFGDHVPEPKGRRLIDLPTRGIDEAQAADLRSRLASFVEEWESPDMDLYDDYDSANARS